MLKFLRFTLYFANLLDFYATDVKSMSPEVKNGAFALIYFVFGVWKIFSPKIGIFQHATPIYDGNFNMHRKGSRFIFNRFVLLHVENFKVHALFC